MNTKRKKAEYKETKATHRAALFGILHTPHTIYNIQHTQHPILHIPHPAPRRKGFGVVEVVVSAAIISLVLVGLVAAFHGALKISAETGKKTQANFLAEEGMEAVRIIRDIDWNNIGLLSTTTTYRLSYSASGWATSTVPVLIDGVFDRTVAVADVHRDGAGKIAPAGAYDPETKQVTVSVSWQKRGATTTVSIATYFARIF